MGLQALNKLKLDAIIGMSVEEAEEYLARMHLSLRTMSIDGEALVGTCDWKPNRVNVSVVDGRVDEVSGLG